MEYLTQEIRRGSCYTAASNLCIVVQDFTVSMHSTACTTKSFRALVPICSRGSVGSLNEISCNNMPWWFWSKGFPTLFSGLFSAMLYDLQMTQRNTYSCQQLMNHSWVKTKVISNGEKAYQSWFQLHWTRCSICKGPVTQAIFVASTRCSVCRA